jgi:creatinine amidohydrolase
VKKIYAQNAKREIRDARKFTAIVPVGCIEAHGDHLPLGTDTIIAQELAVRIAERCNAVALPPIAYGYAYTMSRYAGTLSVSPDALRLMLFDVLHAAYKNGFRRVLVLNGHGGNDGAIKEAIERFADAHGDVRMAWQNWWKIRELGLDVGHADAAETSLMLALRPELVQMRYACDEKERRFFGKVVPPAAEALTRSGVYYKSKGASRKQGEIMLRVIVNKFVSLVENDLLLEEK